MDKLNVGFVGGCINSQPGLTREKFYYSILDRLLLNGQSKFQLKVSFGTYLSFDQLVFNTEKLILKWRPDFIFLFIRPFALMPLVKPIVKYDSSDGTVQFALHPRLIKRDLRWESKLTNYQNNRDFIFKPRRKFELRDLNMLTGLACGLHHWAWKFIYCQIDRINQICSANGIQLFIVAPPKYPSSIVGNACCKLTTTFLKKICYNNGLRFINSNLIGINGFENDLIHFNETGHNTLAHLFFEELIMALDKK